MVRILLFPLAGSSDFSHRVRLKRVVRSPTLYPPYYEPLDPFFPRFITLFLHIAPSTIIFSVSMKSLLSILSISMGILQKLALPEKCPSVM